MVNKSEKLEQTLQNIYEYIKSLNLFSFEKKTAFTTNKIMEIINKSNLITETWESKYNTLHEKHLKIIGRLENTIDYISGDL